MKKSIRVKIDRLIALSKESKPSVQVSSKQAGAVPDSLSSAIRSKKDADIFMQELRSAFHSASRKH